MLSSFKNILVELRFYGSGDTFNISGKLLNPKIVPSYPFNHFLIDISEHLTDNYERYKKYAIKSLLFAFNNTKADITEIEIEVINKGLYSRRMIMANKVYFAEDSIKAPRGKYIIYSMNMEQNHKLEDLHRSQCTNYDRPEDYTSCEDAFIKENLMQRGWGDIKPLFVVDADETTDASEMPDNFTFYPVTERTWDIMNGITFNNCKKPCLMTNIRSTYISEAAFPGGEIIQMFFPEYVNRNTEKVVNFDPLVMLSLAGGNIGLWLGMSVLQVLETVGEIMWKC